MAALDHAHGQAGTPEEQVACARCLFYGGCQGIARDHDRAMDFYNRAALQDDVESMVRGGRVQPPPAAPATDDAAHVASTCAVSLRSCSAARTWWAEPCRAT